MTLITYQSSDSPKTAILALHGWSGDEDSLHPVAKTLRIPDSVWYLPRAPYPSSSGTGFTWFSGSDEEGWKYKKSFTLIDELMDRIREDGFPNDAIYILGFSMGASLAMEYTLRLSYPIAGIIAIAGFIKDKDQLAYDATLESRKTPILILHGEKDDIVPLRSGKKSYDLLTKLEYCVRIETYSAGHKFPSAAGTMIFNFMSDIK
ncbi:MAG: dienelactone hydrolase family protein [Candidatus Marinimicrobia bacterium]|nr:dienelactone hydrolase family protein [Candidatus Neomarinimicrobiota bacterium]MDP7072357.1 dienelactone hydrolase family protein [Candidatus Neomarinimicrobiota bacterium]